jgi:hypothetical protein
MQERGVSYNTLFSGVNREDAYLPTNNS